MSQSLDFEVIRRKMFTLAIDDVCRGFVGLQTLLEVNPTYIKLDKSLNSKIDYSQDKRDLVKSLLFYSKGRSQLIAEGIERFEELQVLKTLGVQFAQGYLLGKPELLRNI